MASALLSFPARTAALVMIATIAACGGATVGEPSETKQEPGAPSGTPSRTPAPRGSNGENSARPPRGVPAPAPVCCPADAVVSGSMNLGGAAQGAPCPRASDFSCSTNWRLGNDAFGCPRWTYDVRKPAPGEDTSCQPTAACTPGAYVFCRCDDGGDGTKLCKGDGTFEACGPCD